MKYVKNRLLSESVKFLELCQGNVLNGRINVETYNLLSDIKLSFISNYLKSEKTRVHFDKKFSSRINNLFAINRMIYTDRDVML